MPLWNGADIFGTANVVTPNPKGAIQVNEFPAIDGVEFLSQGDRGSDIQVTGEFYGASPAAIGSAAMVLYLLAARKSLGVFYDDTTATTWPACFVGSFRFSGETMYSPSHGWTRSFEATITALYHPS